MRLSLFRQVNETPSWTTRRFRKDAQGFRRTCEGFKQTICIMWIMLIMRFRRTCEGLKLELVFRRVVLKLSVLSTFDYGEPVVRTVVLRVVVRSTVLVSISLPLPSPLDVRLRRTRR